MNPLTSSSRPLASVPPLPAAAAATPVPAPATTPTPVVLACPACRSPRVVRTAPSRVTGLRVLRCRQCGMAARDQHQAAPVSDQQQTESGYDGYVQLKRDGGEPSVWREVLSSLLTRARAQAALRAVPGVPTRAPRLFDVGAGDGTFLAIARDEFGFEVHGNEVSTGAVDLARHRNGVELHAGDLSQLAREGDFDAVTLWCVLAHVADSEALLGQVRDLLAPGGTLFLQTPHRTAVDGAALSAMHASSGRWSKLSDRRLPVHHWVLHTPRSITAQLERLGFTDVRVRPQARYTLQSSFYLAGMGVPAPLVGVSSAAVDRLLAQGAAPRIVLDVVARRA